MEAKNFRQEEYHTVVGVKIGGLNWLKDNGIITWEEYEKSMQRLNEKTMAKDSGEPPTGADSGAAAAVSSTGTRAET